MENKTNVMVADKLEKEKRSNKLLVAGLMMLGATSAFAGDDSFGDLYSTFTDWLQGNLGKLLALLGFAGTFIIYMMTHKGSVLFIGIVISLIAGGMVGISQSFFDAGANAFENN